MSYEKILFLWEGKEEYLLSCIYDNETVTITNSEK